MIGSEARQASGARRRTAVIVGGKASIQVRSSFLCALLHIFAACLSDLLLLHTLEEGVGVVPLRVRLLKNRLLPLIDGIEHPRLLFLLLHLHLLRPHGFGKDRFQFVGIRLAVLPWPKFEPR